MEVYIHNDLYYSNFPGELHWWVLLEELHFSIIHEGKVVYSGTVPANFITDLTSIPRPLWGFFPPDGEYAPAAVIHDWLFFIKVTSRLFADQVFYASMRGLGCSYWKGRLFYISVRVGGRRAWREEADKPMFND